MKRLWIGALVATVLVTATDLFAQYAGLMGAAGAAKALSRTQRGNILLFGDTNNRVFLGCFSCNEVDPDSVFNTVGKYGSAISPTSIKNRIAKYGSSISPYSACNELASHPPVVVDEKGNYYGELTINRLRTKRVTEPKVMAWLTAFCASED